MTDFTKTITNSLNVLGTPSKWSNDSPAHGDALIWGSSKWGDTNLIEEISKLISDSTIALSSAVQKQFNQIFEDLNQIVTLEDLVTVELWIDSLYKVVWGGTSTNKVAEPSTSWTEV